MPSNININFYKHLIVSKTSNITEKKVYGGREVMFYFELFDLLHLLTKATLLLQIKFVG